MTKISIGELNSQRAAQAFCDYLKTQDIAAWTEQNGTEHEHKHAIYIESESSKQQAENELNDFLSNPSDRKYLEASWKEGSTETKMPASKKSSAVDFKAFLNRAGRMTKALVAISIAVTLFTQFGSNVELTNLLFISVPTAYPSDLVEIANGEYWRLITPIFMHFMIIHILFNMMWLWDLGGSVERIHSSRFLLFFVLGIGALSNLFEYYSTGHEAFGGMSGVVYGLLGYTWIRSLKADTGFFLPKSILGLMLGWMFLGFTGFLGPIANGAHISGLVLGVAVGFMLNNMKERQWQSLTVVDLHEQGQQWQLVDIRDQNAFNQGHIPKSVNLNNTNFQQYINELDFEKPLVVICYHGNSSKGAANVMCNAGFQNVYSLSGGMSAWSMQHPDLVERS